jgi:hypothetical protein
MNERLVKVEWPRRPRATLVETPSHVRAPASISCLDVPPPPPPCLFAPFPVCLPSFLPSVTAQRPDSQVQLNCLCLFSPCSLPTLQLVEDLKGLAGCSHAEAIQVLPMCAYDVHAAFDVLVAAKGSGLILGARAGGLLTC